VASQERGGGLEHVNGDFFPGLQFPLRQSNPQCGSPSLQMRPSRTAKSPSRPIPSARLRWQPIQSASPSNSYPTHSILRPDPQPQSRQSALLIGAQNERAIKPQTPAGSPSLFYVNCLFSCTNFCAMALCWCVVWTRIEGWWLRI
jgi:hypothetical protein